jgi:hypothetical protein
VIVVDIFELDALLIVVNNNLHILLLGSDTFELDELFKNKFNPPEYCPTSESTYPLEAASLPNNGSGIWGGVLNTTCPLMSILILYALIISTDKLFIETLFDVMLFIDALSADKLSIDTLSADTLLAVILLTDALSADKLNMDALNMDALLADKLNIDALIIDTFAADKFVNVFVTALKLILLPEKFVVVFSPPKLNVFTPEPVSIRVTPVLAEVKILAIPDDAEVHKLQLSPTPLTSKLLITTPLLQVGTVLFPLLINTKPDVPD